MKILLLAAGFVVAIGSTVPPPGGECGCHINGTIDTYTLLSSLLQAVEETNGVVQKVGQMVQAWESRPRHCKDLLDSGDSGKGLRQVYPYPGRPHHWVTVYCDHTVDGGGWTVIQRRSNDTDRQNFYRKWVEYQLGFGVLEGEFWLGLDLIHELTSKTMQELRIDLDDYSGAHRWAKYGYFHVDSSSNNYLLNIGRYSGDAGDSLAYHDKQYFSTYDDDNDNDGFTNCAETRRGAWWFNDCSESNLNGYQHVGHFLQFPGDQGITWLGWRGYKYSLRRTVMMIRPAFY